MADFDQHEYLVGAKRSSKDSSFEFHEHQMWDYNTVSHNVSNVSSSNPKSKQLCNNISSSSSSSSSSLSAPMAIPDCRKIYGTRQVTNDEFFNDEGGYEDEMIPPHEYIAKKLASSQITTFSVCEGAGRTLKGRDLSRVRNAILTKTGFLE